MCSCCHQHPIVDLNKPHPEGDMSPVHWPDVSLDACCRDNAQLTKQHCHEIGCEWIWLAAQEQVHQVLCTEDTTSGSLQVTEKCSELEVACKISLVVNLCFTCKRWFEHLCSNSYKLKAILLLNWNSAVCHDTQLPTICWHLVNGQGSKVHLSCACMTGTYKAT